MGIGTIGFHLLQLTYSPLGLYHFLKGVRYTQMKCCLVYQLSKTEKYTYSLQIVTCILEGESSLDSIVYSEQARNRNKLKRNSIKCHISDNWCVIY